MSGSEVKVRRGGASASGARAGSGASARTPAGPGGPRGGRASRRGWPGAAILIGLLAVAGCRGGVTGAVSSPSGTSPGGSVASSPSASSGTAGSSSSPAGTGSPSGGALCAAIPAITKVDVIRLLPIDKVPSPVNVALPGPGEVTITDPAKARQLAQAVCALPLMPSGVFHCPAALGGAVELRFATADQALPPVTAWTSGCQAVHGLGPTRWAAKSPEFWTVLTRLAGSLGITHSP